MNYFDNQAVNRSMSSSTIIPVLGYNDVIAATDWLCRNFGFKERWRAGNHRAQLAIGDGTIAISQQQIADVEQYAQTMHYSLMIRVNDVDAHYQHVLESGAKILHPPADFPYGERQYTVIDLGGYTWTFSQSIADLAPEDWLPS